jgi:hypothetical protein
MSIRSEEYSMFKSVKSPSLVAALLPVAVLACVAVPASAKSDPTQSRLTKETVNGKTVYCASGKVTGSRLPSRTCLSMEDWQNRGVVFPNGEAQEAAESTEQSKS